MRNLVLAVTILAATNFTYKSQIESHVKWSYAAKKVGSTEVVVFLKATIDDGWHIYALDLKDGGPTKTSFTFASSKEYTLEGKSIQPNPIIKYEKTFGMNVGYFEKSVIFQQKIKLRSPNARVVKGQLEYMTCNDKKCLPPEDLDFLITLNK